MQRKNRRPSIALFILISILLSSCQDSVQDLSGGYFFRNEGGNIKDILCHEPGHGEIPATVVGYAFDKNFILAKQLPKMPPDPMYEGTYVYGHGSEVPYYWVIDLKRDTIWGPMQEVEFNKVRVLAGVPADLDIPPE